MEFKRITDIHELQLKANTIRKHIVKMLSVAKSGHPGGALGMTDVFTALYFHVAVHNPKIPDWYLRDRVVVSNGHICPVLYATLAECGYFAVNELKTLRQIDSRLQGHPHYGSLPGVETSTGPLGQGITVALGMALGLGLNKTASRVYCVVGDGELQEGACWEALMIAGHKNANRLCLIVDRNNMQIDGTTQDVLSIEPLVDKLESFGFHVIEVNGHDMQDIIDALEESKVVGIKPTAIIAHTIPGKGVSFMERDYKWHGKAPTSEQTKIALVELEHQRELLEGHND